MGREIRRVPPDWEHPVYTADTAPRRDWIGHHIPLYDRSYREAAEEWMAGYQAWQNHTHRDWEKFHDRYPYFWDWDSPPNQEHYREEEWTPEEATAYQMYETVSEGTPVSPVFETTDQLWAWLVNEKGYSHAAADAFIRDGWAPSMVVFNPGDGTPPRIGENLEGLVLMDEEG
jgi:hypothetical protein